MEFHSEELVTVLNQFAKPAGEAIINYYDPAKRAYSIFYLYPTGESEKITVPACRIIKHKTANVLQATIKDAKADRWPTIF